MVLKVGPCNVLYISYMIYITVLGCTDFEHLFFSIISNQSCNIKMDLS